VSEVSKALACDIIAEVLCCAPESVRGDAAVGSLPGWDSIAHVNIVLAVEARLGRPLTPEEIGTARTVADFASFLNSRASAPLAGSS
jgi:acyl carrier protein